MTDYGELFRELAVPRLVGTPNHQKVREVLKRELSARGFEIEEHAFSGRPSRAFFGSPAIVRGVNLIAPPVRPSAHPPVWLVAHYDSKGQPISMALRLVGFGALVAGLPTVLLVPLLGAVLLALGVAIALFNRVTDNSPGALDNASALVTIFMTLDQLPSDAGVGVIFPDAEEYGLVGARALAVERAQLFAGASVVNLDGIDDSGGVTAFLHRPGSAVRVVANAVGAGTWRWLPVIVDGIALAPASRECVTIMKGGWHTMLVVHRPADTARRLRLDGAASVAAGLARVLRTP